MRPGCPAVQIAAEPREQPPAQEKGEQWPRSGGPAPRTGLGNHTEEEERKVCSLRGRQEEVCRRCFYFSQPLWKEPQGLQSKEPRRNNVEDLTKAAAPLCCPPAVACLCRGSVQWVILHSQMLARALLREQEPACPLHTWGSLVQLTGDCTSGKARKAMTESRQSLAFSKDCPWQAAGGVVILGQATM